ncbi:MAG: efflux RND transporter periplasmic adaptor subunit [Planctomycetaceae bacterium]|nr:efflux RND transporter periplasmic adaptor subunit [Planctomycetaceae bacterium]
MKYILPIAGAMLLSAFAGAFVVWSRVKPQPLVVEQMEPRETESEVSGDIQPSTVTLNNEKAAATSLKVEGVQERPVRPFNTVAGRLRYDDQRHIEVRVATSGVLTSVHVKPGDRVKAGEVLAELNSSEVGHARADVLQREADLAIVTQKRDWEQLVCQGIQKMAGAIQGRQPLDQIQEQLRGVSLGSAREKILSNYSQLLLAESLTKSAQQNVATGVVPAKVLQERQTERDTAEASLQGTLEQLIFDARQSCRQAEVAVNDAQRRLKISRQNVATLLGQVGADVYSDDQLDMDESVLSLVRVRAPFASTVEQKNFSTSERVSIGDSLFVLADTSTLWVAADLRDRDRGALALNPGDEIEVFVTPGSTTPVVANVYFVGREVDPSTNAVPLIAVIRNTDGSLRPGMYVTVRVPLGEAKQAIAVPESAIVEHDSQKFVFVPDDQNTFHRVDVTTGLSSGDYVQILSGVNAGDQVVVAGAFVLKSEMLLEREE